MNLRIALSVAEVLLLVIVLAFFLNRVASQLRHIVATLLEIDGGVQAIESHAAIIGPGGSAINSNLSAAAQGLTAAAGLTKQLADG